MGFRVEGLGTWGASVLLALSVLMACFSFFPEVSMDF